MDNVSDYNAKLTEEFRTTRDQEGGPVNGRPVVLLTTTGAKSGKQHTTPLMFVRDGARVLVIASNAGAPKDPDWYHNLTANPDVGVEIGKETYKAKAVVQTGAERERLWPLIVGQAPFFAEHQAKITREIPVIALERQAD